MFIRMPALQFGKMKPMRAQATSAKTNVPVTLASSKDIAQYSLSKNFLAADTVKFGNTNTVTESFTINSAEEFYNALDDFHLLQHNKRTPEQAWEDEYRARALVRFLQKDSGTVKWNLIKEKEGVYTIGFQDSSMTMSFGHTELGEIHPVMFIDRENDILYTTIDQISDEPRADDDLKHHALETAKLLETVIKSRQ